MTMTVFASLVILITLPISYGFVKGISYLYEARAADVRQLNRLARHAAHERALFSDK